MNNPRYGDMQKITKEQFDEFVRGFIDAALWSSYDEGRAQGFNDDEVLSQNYSADDLTHSAKIKLTEACQKFVDANEADLVEYAEKMKDQAASKGDGTAWGWAGHDLWLTLHGHGTGFWDRGLGQLGDRLTAAVQMNVPQFTLFVNEEDRIEAE